MNLKTIGDEWEFVPNGASSYWFEQTDDGSGETISPQEVLERGIQLEAENITLRETIDALIREIP